MTVRDHRARRGEAVGRHHVGEIAPTGEGVALFFGDFGRNDGIAETDLLLRDGFSVKDEGHDLHARLVELTHGLKAQPHLVLIPHVIVVAKQIVVCFHPFQHTEEVGAGAMLALIAKQLYVLMLLRVVFLQCHGAVGRPVVVDVDGEIGIRLPQERINQFAQILGSVVGGQ